MYCRASALAVMMALAESLDRTALPVNPVFVLYELEGQTLPEIAALGSRLLVPPMGPEKDAIAAAFQSAQITPLLALVALLLGGFAVLVTPREEEPQINVTMANVLIPFPGASSTDVQNMVARPAEQVLGQISGIEHYVATLQANLLQLARAYEYAEKHFNGQNLYLEEMQKNVRYAQAVGDAPGASMLRRMPPSTLKKGVEPYPKELVIR